MAISAYDPSGRLKKHAFLGTSFAIDPTQQEKRRKLGELYEEFKSSGAKGQEAAAKDLGTRYQKYAENELGRLAQISEQKAGFAEEMANLKTPEERFAEFNFMPSTFVPNPKFEEERRRNVMQQFQKEYAQKTGNISAAYTTLVKEEADRNRRLADKLELYSMFLGA